MVVQRLVFLTEWRSRQRGALTVDVNAIDMHPGWAHTRECV
jgi:hypothetical protein